MIMKDLSMEDWNYNRIRTITGITLIAVGMCIAMWLLFCIYLIISHPEQQALLNYSRIVVDSINKVLANANLPNIPEGFDFFAGMFFAIILLGMIGGMAKAIISGGIRLFTNDCENAIKDLTREIGKLRAGYKEYE